MNKLTLVHCIETKTNSKFEREAKLYLNSIRTTNPELFKNVDIHFLQPTANDIAQDTIDYMHSYGAKFTRIPDLSNKQVNNKINYTNACVTGEYFSQTLETEYMCWTDLDIIFLQTAPADFYRATDRIVLTAYDIDNTYSKQCDGFRVDQMYHQYFQQYLPADLQELSIKHYICTWFVYGLTKHPFWIAWRKLTYDLVDIVQQHHQDMIQHDFESYCEEIAASMLYARYPEWFSDIREFFGQNTLSFMESKMENEDAMRCRENTVVYHYNDLSGLLKNDMPNYSYSRNALRMVLDTFDVNELINGNELTARDIITLGR